MQFSTVTASAWYTPLDKKPKITLRQTVLFGMLGALTFAAKVAMSGLPNIEPVSLFVMIFASVFGLKALYPVYVYVVMELLVYGLHLWSINYLYVWAVLAVAAWLLRNMKGPVLWAVLGGVFGLMFGLICTPVYWISGGPGYVVQWWISGIPYDVAHCVGNFVLALVLFVPLRKLLSTLYQRIQK